MPSRVLKFGGAALRDGPAVARAVGLVCAHGGDRPIVVVSAHLGVTHELEQSLEAALGGRLEWDALRVRHRTILRQLDLPGDFLDRHLRELRAILAAVCRARESDRRIRDFVLSFGERMSARVFAACLRRSGVEAAPLDAFDLGLVAETRDRHRRPAPDGVGVLLDRLPGAAVVTGFVALDEHGHLTTLGRNGSDLTAVWLAEAIGAVEVQLWKDVPGFLTADPKLVPGARRLDRVGWTEAAALATHGAEVVHPGAVQRAAEAGVEIWLRDLSHPDQPGTRISQESGERTHATPSKPVALARRRSLALGRKPLDLGREHGRQLASLFETLAGHGIEPYLAFVATTEALLLLTDEPGLARAWSRLENSCELERGWASVALVGPGVGRDPAVEASFQQLSEELGVELRLNGGGTEEGACVGLLREEALEPFVKALHRRWFAGRLLPAPRIAPAKPVRKPQTEDS